MANKGGNRHMKVSSIPRSWPRGGKSVRFLTKPRAGPHSTEFSLPLVTLVRDVFRLAGTAREVKLAINGGKIKINNKVRRDEKFPVGPFDIISVQDYGEFSLLPKKGVGLYPIKYKGPRYLRVEGKRLYSGKYQISLHDGSTVIVEKGNPLSSVQVGSSLVFELDNKKWVPKLQLPLTENSQVIIVGGKNEGVLGRVTSISPEQVNISTPDGQNFQTSKDHVYVIDENLLSNLSSSGGETS